MNNALRFLVPVCLLGGMLSNIPASGGWPGFRGPVDDDVSAESLPLVWSETENVRWVADLVGTGQSSPVVWDNHVYITSVEGPNKETCHLEAVELSSGQKLWKQSVENATPAESTNYVSKAAPTAVVDQVGVVALFEGGNLLALGHDGTRRWERNLVAEYGNVDSRHGLSSSLLQVDAGIIVWVEREADPYILLINPQSGENIWKVSGLGVTAWSSPTLLTVEGSRHLVFSGGGVVTGINPENGEVLWQFKGLSGNTTPSPSAVGDGLLLVGATDGRGEGAGGKASDSNGLLRIAKDEEGEYKATFVWRAKRATCSFGSPMSHQGYAYFVNRTGIVFCLDLMTGEEQYAERTPESCWATPVGIGDRVYLVGQRGTTTVLKAGKEFEKLAENRAWDKNPEGGPPTLGEGQIQYAIAAVPGCLLIRTGERLLCVANTPKE